jgi:hypothetical protein
MVSDKALPFQRKLILNGYPDELAYKRGTIASELPFEETKGKHFISKIAKKYNDDPHFSQKIRAHLQRRDGS